MERDRDEIRRHPAVERALVRGGLAALAALLGQPADSAALARVEGEPER